MKIEGVDQQALNIMRGDRAAERTGEKRRVEAQVAEENLEAVAADPLQSMKIDFSKLGEAHSLDADRVASLIADPFGDDLL